MGDTAHASGPAPCDDNSGGARGDSALEAAVSKLASRVVSKITEQQEKQSTNIRTLAEAVQVLRSDMSSLKRKHEGDGISPKKSSHIITPADHYYRSKQRVTPTKHFYVKPKTISGAPNFGFRL